jgi:hypothetical protein
VASEKSGLLHPGERLIQGPMRREPAGTLCLLDVLGYGEPMELGPAAPLEIEAGVKNLQLQRDQCSRLASHEAINRKIPSHCQEVTGQLGTSAGRGRLPPIGASTTALLRRLGPLPPRRTRRHPVREVPRPPRARGGLGSRAHGGIL